MLRTLLLAAALPLPALAAAQSAKPDANTIQVTSRIVYVDITVRDSAGNVVRGLNQNDFHVFEDGKPQQIDYFAEHVYNGAVQPIAKPLPNLEFSNTSTPGNANAVTVLLLDLLNTSSQEQLTAREQMLKFLGALPQGRPISLFTLTDKLQMIQSFTGSPKLLAAAAKMLKPVNLGQMPSREDAQVDSDTAREFDRESSPTGRSPSGSTAVDRNVQTQESDLDLRTHSTIAALTQLAYAMSGYEGRKNLYWISESFPIALNTTNGLGQTLPVDAQRMTSRLADARIAVYPVSVLGLDLGTSSVLFSGRAGNLPDPRNPSMQRGTLKAIMNGIADETGGQAIVGTNDLAGAMRRNLDDSGNYYTLAYQPQNKKWNKQFRSIRVELAQTGDSLSYRRGYFAYPDSPPSSPNPLQQLDIALQPDMSESTLLLLSANVDLPDRPGGSVMVHSVLEPANLGLITAADGHRRGQIAVRLIALSETPDKPSNHAGVPLQSSALLNLDFDPAQYQAVLKSGITFTQQLKLPPGHYRLRLGVSDVVSHRLGTLDMPISIPAQIAAN